MKAKITWAVKNMLAYRIGFIAIFGPIYAWRILAKTAMSLTPSPKDNIGKIRYIMINN